MAAPRADVAGHYEVEKLADDLGEVYGINGLDDAGKREEMLGCARLQVQERLEKGVSVAEIARGILSLASRSDELRPVWNLWALRIGLGMDRSRAMAEEQNGEVWRRIRAKLWGDVCPPDKAQCAGYTKVVHTKTSADIPCPIAATGCPWKADRDAVQLNRRLAAIGIEAQYRCAREDQMLPTIGTLAQKVIAGIDDAIRLGRIVYLSGRPCTGKSCAAAMIVRAAVRLGKTGGWRTEAQLVRGAAPEALQAVDVMVIDDLGASGGNKEALRLFLDQRDGQGKGGLTICTGNAAKDDLERDEQYARIIPRLFQKVTAEGTARSAWCWQPLEGLGIDEVPLWAREAWGNAGNGGDGRNGR